jgi:hypothetical protein
MLVHVSLRWSVLVVMTGCATQHHRIKYALANQCMHRRAANELLKERCSVQRGRALHLS